MTLRHPVKLRDFGRAYALLLADSVPETAVVFVHGFGGDSFKTWLSFQTLADENAAAFPWWATSDMFFFDYQDVKGAIQFSGEDLEKFIGQIYPTPESSLFQADVSAWRSPLHLDQPVIRMRHEFAGYKQLVLAGHSEGAVVIRKAVLAQIGRCVDANKKVQAMAAALNRPAVSVKEVDESDLLGDVLAPGGGGLRLPKRGGGDVVIRSAGPASPSPSPSPLLGLTNYPLAQAELCLFAPAIMGAAASGILGWLQGKISILHFSRAYNDLGRDSPVLRNLQIHTERYADDYPEIKALRAHVLWGRNEEIVTADQYIADIAEPAEPGQSHTSVCKPRPGYLRPLQFVRYYP